MDYSVSCCSADAGATFFVSSVPVLTTAVLR